MTTHRSKSDDSYEEGSFQASKTMTVTRMATSRGPIPVTLDTFEALGGRRWGDTMGGVGTRSADAYIGFRDIAPMMENQVGKNVDSEVETGFIILGLQVKTLRCLLLTSRVVRLGPS